MTIGLLKNTIQNYAWGSVNDIAQLLGKPNITKTPQAELWMGAHPKAPSLLFKNGRWVALSEIIQQHPVEMLGEKTAKKFNNRLPYLFKVLAAGKPLSIQAHPDLNQAKKGFHRENQQNIPMDAFNRNYKDENHKPECICALTTLWALNGFCSPSRMMDYFNQLCPEIFDGKEGIPHPNPDPMAMRTFFKTLMAMEAKQKKTVITLAVKNAGKKTVKDPVCKWVVKLHAEYGYDVGVLAPIFLNLICLQPGEALYLPTGRLHAYLSGMGIELMANSDNVLRGGLTPKHVDVPELLNVLRFETTASNILVPKKVSPTEAVYPTQTEEFVLSVIRVSKPSDHISSEKRSAEILLCADGNAQIKAMEGSLEITQSVTKGDAVFVPSAANRYSISGIGVFYKAGIPQK